MLARSHAGSLLGTSVPKQAQVGALRLTGVGAIEKELTCICAYCNSYIHQACDLCVLPLRGAHRDQEKETKEKGPE